VTPPSRLRDGVSATVRHRTEGAVEEETSMFDCSHTHRFLRHLTPTTVRSRALAFVLVAVLAGVAAGQSVTLSFDKASASDTVWIGTVDGDVAGTLTTVLIAADTSRPVWDVEFYWIVTAADPALSFVARLMGTLDTGTGEVAMQGLVVDGYRKGATVDESGSLYDPDRSAFRGTIVLHGASTASLR
jgi:hypothetical protein